MPRMEKVPGMSANLLDVHFGGFGKMGGGCPVTKDGRRGVGSIRIVQGNRSGCGPMGKGVTTIGRGPDGGRVPIFIGSRTSG